MRVARSEGPQRVSVRGEDAVVIVSAQDYDRLVKPEAKLSFVEFMESLYFEGLDLRPRLGA